MNMSAVFSKGLGDLTVLGDELELVPLHIARPPWEVGKVSLGRKAA
jgi:hypothetical protein